MKLNEIISNNLIFFTGRGDYVNIRDRRNLTINYCI